MLWITIPMIALAVACLLPVAVFCAECGLALLPRRRTIAVTGARPSVTVLVPAHNEESGLEATIRSITPQLQAGDGLLVVADNCTDRTAAVARRMGVGVVERFDAVYKGKGYALDHGVSHLRRRKESPDVVIMIDADCTAQPGAIDALSRQVLATHRPAQACYLLERPADGGSRDSVSALAFLVKNLVRPTGLRRAGLPCLCTGAGMAFPWSAIAQTALASGNIVEDMQLSLDLALEGRAALFCGDAHITGRLPTKINVAYGQRTRWEHGHLQTLLRQVPRLIGAGFRHFAGQALALGLDLAVPPLALLMMALLAALGAASIAGTVGAGWLAAKLLAGGVGAMGLSILLAWAKFGRKSLPFGALLAAPLYMAWKVPMYVAFLVRRQTEWNRTARADVPFEMPPAGAGDAFSRDFNRDALPGGQLRLGELVRPTRAAEACVDLIVQRLAAGRGGVAVLPTVEHVQWCAADADFARLMADYELVAEDPADPAALAAPATQMAFVTALARAAASAERSVFLLGDDGETTAEAGATLTLAESTLRLAGLYSTPPGHDSDPNALRHLTAALVRAKPDLVLVALGTPKQERLIDRLRLRLPNTWWLVVGPNFDFLRREPRRSRSRDLTRREPKRPLDELGELLSRGVGQITVADRSDADPQAVEPSTIVYQSFLMGLRSGWQEHPISTVLIAPEGPLSKLKAIVLLGGAIRPSRLTRATGRSVFDLPLEDGRSILWHWRDHAVDVRQKLALTTLPVHVLIDANSPQPDAPHRGNHVPVTVQQDASPYRGTAGVLADWARTGTFEDDDYLLVGTAAQVLLAPLWETAAGLAALGADAATVSHADGTASGLMLIRCGPIRAIPSVGYVDLKEQALPTMLKTFSVRHLPCLAPTALPVRTPGEYIDAIQHRHRQALGRPLPSDPFAEDCRPSFAVVEDGAMVHASAQVHDSVILDGAQIADGATVIRSVVCSGARLLRNQSVIDGVLVADEAANRHGQPSSLPKVTS